MTEAYITLPKTLQYYGIVENGKITKYGAEIPFNFELQVVMKNAVKLKRLINGWLLGMPKGEKIHANWVVSEMPNSLKGKFCYFIILSQF